MPKEEKFCMNCGAKIDADAEICPVCGTKQPSLEEQIEEKLGFGWGKFWIITGFWFGGIALIFGFLKGQTTEYIPNGGVALIIAILGIGSAFGLLKRKKYGLYLVYATLVLSVLGGLASLIESSTEFLIQGLITLPVSYLWFRYFQRRKEWFK